jgi:hypothetical protein
MSLQLLYLIFIRACGRLVLLGRSSASKNAELWCRGNVKCPTLPGEQRHGKRDVARRH